MYCTRRKVASVTRPAQISELIGVRAPALALSRDRVMEPKPTMEPLMHAAPTLPAPRATSSRLPEIE